VNRCRHGLAIRRAHRFARLTRALSVAIPVFAYICRYSFEINTKVSRARNVGVHRDRIQMRRLFIANLAFSPNLIGEGKLGIFAASVVCAAAGLVLLGTSRVIHGSAPQIRRGRSVRSPVAIERRRTI
jgi:hypothetical protein